jgi:hypothetical protein
MNKLPSLTGRQVVKALQKAGFTVIRLFFTLEHGASFQCIHYPTPFANGGQKPGF